MAAKVSLDLYGLYKPGTPDSQFAPLRGASPGTTVVQVVEERKEREDGEHWRQGTIGPRGRRAAGAGQAPSLDALLAHGGLRPRAGDPGDRPRRGRLRLGRQGEPLPRRALLAVLR